MAASSSAILSLSAWISSALVLFVSAHHWANAENLTCSAFFSLMAFAFSSSINCKTFWIGVTFAFSDTAATAPIHRRRQRVRNAILTESWVATLRRKLGEELEPKWLE